MTTRMRLVAVAILTLGSVLTGVAAGNASEPRAPATADAAADELAAALTSSDFARIQAIVTPSGFNWARAGSGGLAPMTPQETADFLRTQSAGRLDVSVQARPLQTNVAGPFPGSLYIASTFRSFGNLPSQSVNLVIGQVGGAWYWSGALTNAPTAVPSASAQPMADATRGSTLPSTATRDEPPFLAIMLIAIGVVLVLAGLRTRAPNMTSRCACRARGRAGCQQVAQQAGGAPCNVHF